ncbi:hypothetical protein TDB9533_03695 [Thalassocella blandensis]|nr:hypothetical protein TDB9533_03695 [Thalassocella blandensis]
MSKKKVWLYYHKATVAPQTPVNMDGSEFMIGVSIVPADTLIESKDKFEEDLSRNHMSALEVYNAIEYSPDAILPDSDLNKQIIKSVEHAIRRDLVHYICEATSESLKNQEDGDN